MILSDEDINILSKDIPNLKKIINGDKEVETLTKPEISMIIKLIKKKDKTVQLDSTLPQKELIDQVSKFLNMKKISKRKPTTPKKNHYQSQFPLTEEKVFKKTKLEEKERKFGRDLSNEERRIMSELENDPLDKNHQDPYFKIEQILDVFWLKATIKGFIRYSFPIDSNFDGKVHLQFYDFVSLEPKDWQSEIGLKINDIDQSVPQILKRTKKQNKNILVVHNPIDITQHTKDKNIITISMRIPSYITCDGVIACLLVKEQTTEDLINQVKIIGKEEDSSTKKENVSLIFGLSTPKFYNFLEDCDKGVKTKNLSLIEKSIDNILKKNQDSDIIVHSEEVISLKDNVTLKRIDIAAKSERCNHRQCFDLKVSILNIKK